MEVNRGIIEMIVDGVMTVEEFYERIDLLIDIKDSIGDNASKEYIRDILMAHGLCPECAREFEIEEYFEDRGEYFGYSACENVKIAKCYQCGWSETDE